MHTPSTGPLDGDEAVLLGQLGRPPRAPWSVGVRCGFGRPSVLVTPPALDEGAPFPTLFWLTCPWLVDEVSRRESAGEAGEWARRFSEDSDLAGDMRSADRRYRELREAAGGGEDPCGDVGIAGQSDPLATKCLHAHLAAYLAGVDDPVGKAVAVSIEPECPDDRCARLSDPGAGG